MTKIATAAGFQSVRHMNRVVKQVFSFTPRELRARRRDPSRLVADGGLELRLPYRPPLAWDALLEFLAPRAIPGVEHVDLDAAVYRRTLRPSTVPGRVIEVGDEDAAGRRCCCARTSPTARSRPPRLAGAPAVRSRRRPGGDRPAPGSRSAPAPARARPPRAARAGRDRPARDRGPRDPRSAGVGRPCDPPRRPARRRLRHARCRARRARPRPPLPRPRRRWRDAPIADLGIPPPAPARSGPSRRRPSRSTARSARRARRRAAAAPRRGRLDGAVRRDAGRGERDAFPAGDLGLRHALGGDGPDRRSGGRAPALAGVCGHAPVVRARPLGTGHHSTFASGPHDLCLPRS